MRFKRFLPVVMLGDADSITSKYIESSPVVLTGQDAVLATTTGVQDKSITPEQSSSVDPATVSVILPNGSDSRPTGSELIYASTGISTAKDIIASEPSPKPTGLLDATSSYSPSPTLSTTTPLSSNSSTLVSTQIASSTAIASDSSTTPAITDSTTFSGGSSKTTKIAIAVPVSVISLALILALLFFLSRRRRRDKERNTLPPSYDIATGHRTAVSTQELMISPKSSTPEPGRSSSTPAISSMAMSMSMPRFPMISISPPTESRDRTPSLGPNSGTSLRRMSMTHGLNDSEAELGVAVAVPMDQRRSATEQDLRGRVASVASSRGPSRLARMPFEDFSDDEVGIGIAHGGSDDEYDDAVSDVSDLDGRRREGDFDEHSVVSSLDEVSPIGEQERRRFRAV